MSGYLILPIKVTFHFGLCFFAWTQLVFKSFPQPSNAIVSKQTALFPATAILDLWAQTILHILVLQFKFLIHTCTARQNSASVEQFLVHSCDLISAALLK